ncbi:sigma-54 dependent transcriptional regulator [Methylophaga sp.]|uniref:sigma-54-dependent transcriptional regulator n=1 Tax=Methylophaga sp. TaxID=2024840 RepID=UPI0013FFE1B0|nr:sigma-54 dependent transcriptional regulator [Methylophaga sp.]MTI62675.1 sigma-54-dependent Fis family transcriptional regulator [Methylophaga sp.]
MMHENNKQLLVVEDDHALADLISEELETEGWTVSVVHELQAAFEKLSGMLPAIIVTDLRLPDGDGMSLVETVMQMPGVDERPGLIVITAFGSVKQAVAALHAGADDFLTKPLDMEHFLLTVERVMEARQIKVELKQFRQLGKQQQFYGMFGQSESMRHLFEQIKVIAKAQGPVLIHGESGTGKELVAKALHGESERADGPFLAVNCAGIPSDLLESEFFGHAAGAFTGASKKRKGLMQQAHGGSLLLDEIGEMPLSLQAKLLRALEDGSIRPVGQDTEEKVDVRIIAATHRDLKQKVEDGSFREDLYYRLEAFGLSIPALREREEDQELLAQLFLRQIAIERGRSIKGFDDKALALIRDYDFPGNVRELHNVVERAVAFCNEEWIRAPHLPARLTSVSNPDISAASQSAAMPHEEQALLKGPVMPSLPELQRRYVRMVLDTVDGNKRRAAAILGIGRKTLYRWLEEE